MRHIAEVARTEGDGGKRRKVKEVERRGMWSLQTVTVQSGLGEADSWDPPQRSGPLRPHLIYNEEMELPLQRERKPSAQQVVRTTRSLPPPQARAGGV